MRLAGCIAAPVFFTGWPDQCKKRESRYDLVIMNSASPTSCSYLVSSMAFLWLRDLARDCVASFISSIGWPDQRSNESCASTCGLFCVKLSLCHLTDSFTPVYASNLSHINPPIPLVLFKQNRFPHNSSRPEPNASSTTL